MQNNKYCKNYKYIIRNGNRNMYLNDLNSAQHSVSKLNKILADTFDHEVDLSAMNYESLNNMLSTTNAKMIAIKEDDLKYWENPQYNKLGLIQHQLKTYITEIAPTRNDGKRMKTKESIVMEDDLEQAEVMLAAQELVDELQGMVEDVAEMQVQKLMPIVDAMKEQVGFEQAEAYNNAADGALGALLDAMKTAKGAVENATLTARGEAPAEAMPTDMGMSDADMDPEAPMDGAQDMDMEAPDEFAGDDAAAGEDNAIGRELKGESALTDMERGALAEKKFLESKGKLFKMVESGQMSQTDFINLISELDEKRKGDRGFTPGVQEPEMRLKNQRGFIPGEPEPGYEPGNRGFIPGEPEPGYEPGNRGFIPGAPQVPPMPTPDKPSRPSRPSRPKIPSPGSPDAPLRDGPPVPKPNPRPGIDFPMAPPTEPSRPVRMGGPRRMPKPARYFDPETGKTSKARP